MDPPLPFCPFLFAPYIPLQVSHLIPGDPLLDLSAEYEVMDRQLQESLRVPQALLQGERADFVGHEARLAQARVAAAERHRLFQAGHVSLATYQELEELAAARGNYLDLRPGADARRVVDSLVNEIPAEQLLDPSVLQAPSRPLSNNRQGWMVEELPPVWGNSPLSMLRELQMLGRFLPGDLQVEEHDGPGIYNERAIQAMGATVDYDAQYSDAHYARNDSQVIDVSYVRHPIDPRTRIRTPEMPLTPRVHFTEEEIRSRRYPLIDRGTPEPLPPEPPKAHIFWPTSWEHLLQEDPF